MTQIGHLVIKQSLDSILRPSYVDFFASYYAMLDTLVFCGETEEEAKQILADYLEKLNNDLNVELARPIGGMK